MNLVSPLMSISLIEYISLSTASIAATYELIFEILEVKGYFKLKYHLLYLS